MTHAGAEPGEVAKGDPSAAIALEVAGAQPAWHGVAWRGVSPGARAGGSFSSGAVGRQGRGWGLGGRAGGQVVL